MMVILKRFEDILHCNKYLDIKKSIWFLKSIQYKLPQHENIVRFIEGEILKEDDRTS